MKKVKQIILGAILVAPLAMSMACDSSNSGSGGGETASLCGGLGSSGFQGIVDLAVGDDENNRVVLYEDVLAATDTQSTTGLSPAAAPTPTLSLDNTTSLINDPQALALVTDSTTGGDNDLYVGQGSGSNILIFRGYPTLANNTAPDVVLDALADINTPAEILVTADDELVVADRGDDEVLVFDAASAIVADIAPDVILDNATSLIDDPVGIFVTNDQTTGSDDDLYVINEDNTAGAATVVIFRDISTLVSAQAPDVRLNEDTSFFSDAGADNLEGYDVTVNADILYASVQYNGETSAIFVFEGAGALASNALPDAVLFGASSYLDGVRSMHVLSATTAGTAQLLAANENFDTGVCTDAPGLVGFVPDSDGSFFTGQGANIIPSQDTSGLGLAFNIQEGGGALFVQGTRENCEEFPYSIYIFRNATSNGICSSSQPNIIIPATGFTDPTPGFGDFGNAAYYNGMAVGVRATTN